MRVHVFAYGSNMSTGRIRRRAETAEVVATGYVTHRMIRFHKRSVDGSGKADAWYTSREDDRVWGVVYSLSAPDKATLDGHEPGYEQQEVNVFAEDERIEAIAYVAKPESIDSLLLPYCWYHRYVIDGAIEHELPDDYIEDLRGQQFINDPCKKRRGKNTTRSA